MRSLVQTAAEKEIPIAGMFELTAKCNLHCGFCYVCDREKQMISPPEKSADEWIAMIRQAADQGLLKCTFTGGDPFMREDFEEIYCKAYDMGLRISIFTNGILIGKKQRAYLSRRVPDLISITLYGASEAAYQDVCGGKDNFRRTMESLDGLHAAGLCFELKVLAIRPLLYEYEAMGNIAAKYQCPGRFETYISPGRDDPERNLRDWRVPPARVTELMRSFTGPLASFSQKQEEKRAVNHGGVFHCKAGKSSFIITYDGRMLGCPSLTCFEAFPFRDGFVSAWYTLKDMIKSAEACSDCANCQEQGRCSFCPADRLCETGSITACSPYLKEMVSILSAMDQEMSG